MALPLIPLAAMWAPVVKEFLLQFAPILSYLWECTSLTAAINWAPLVASVLAPQLKPACSFISAAYNLVGPLVRFARFVRFVGFFRFVRFAHLAAKTFFLLHPVLQLGIVLIVLCGVFVVYMSPLCVVARTLFRFVPRLVRSNPFFWFKQGLRFARCANLIRGALSCEPLYR